MTFQRNSNDIKRHVRQKDKVLAYLQTGAPLTQDVAQEKFNCRRLASRISELKKAGHVILSLRHETGVAVYLLLEGREC